METSPAGARSKEHAAARTRLMGRGPGAPRPAAAAAILGTLWLVIAIAALYPAFQAMVLRWWISGLRFGELTATSHLRTGAVYRSEEHTSELQSRGLISY